MLYVSDFCFPLALRLLPQWLSFLSYSRKLKALSCFDYSLSGWNNCDPDSVSSELVWPKLYLVLDNHWTDLLTKTSTPRAFICKILSSPEILWFCNSHITPALNSAALRAINALNESLFRKHIFIFKSQFSSIIYLRIQFLETLHKPWPLPHYCQYPIPKERLKKWGKALCLRTSKASTTFL